MRRVGGDVNKEIWAMTSSEIDKYLRRVRREQNKRTKARLAAMEADNELELLRIERELAAKSIGAKQNEPRPKKLESATERFIEKYRELLDEDLIEFLQIPRRSTAEVAEFLGGTSLVLDDPTTWTAKRVRDRVKDKTFKAARIGKRKLGVESISVVKFLLGIDPDDGETEEVQER